MQSKQSVEQAWIRGWGAAVSWLIYYGLDLVLARRCMKAMGLSQEQIKSAGLQAHERREIVKIGVQPKYHIYGEHDVSNTSGDHRSSTGVRIYRTSQVDGEPEMESTLVLVVGSKRTEVVQGKTSVYYSFEGLDPLTVGVPVGEIDFFKLALVGMEAQEDQIDFQKVWEDRNKPTDREVTTMKLHPTGTPIIRTVQDIRKLVLGDEAAKKFQVQEDTELSWKRRADADRMAT